MSFALSISCHTFHPVSSVSTSEAFLQGGGSWGRSMGVGWVGGWGARQRGASVPQPPAAPQGLRPAGLLLVAGAAQNARCQAAPTCQCRRDNIGPAPVYPPPPRWPAGQSRPPPVGKHQKEPGVRHAHAFGRRAGSKHSRKRTGCGGHGCASIAALPAHRRPCPAPTWSSAACSRPVTIFSSTTAQLEGGKAAASGG